jgi:hypothetical protein
VFVLRGAPAKARENDTQAEARCRETSPGARLGGWKGVFTIPDDFDAPLDDFKEYMA